MKTYLNIISLLLFIHLSVFCAFASEIVSFTPQGNVKAPSQVMAQFSNQMVSLGSLSTLEPFEIDCPLKGNPRWIDTYTWAYDFDEPLPSGLMCKFKLKSHLKDISGMAVKGKDVYIFNTGGPKILETLPFEGSNQIDERQIFLIKLDGPAKKDSVIRNAFCSVSGINERIGIRILEEDDLVRLKKALRHEGFSEGDYVFAIQCNRTFPSKAEVKLIWSKNIESPSGLKSDQDQVFSFKSREPFKATFSCHRENPKSHCIPLMPITLRFTSAISWSDANKITLLGSDNKIYKPHREDYGFEESFVYTVKFKAPFKENSEYAIHIPKDLKDDSGRVLTNQKEFPLKVKTGIYPPLAKFPSRFGILEAKAEPAIPLTVRNIETTIEGTFVDVKESLDSIKGRLKRVDDDEQAIIQWLFRLAVADRQTSVFKNFNNTDILKIPKPSSKETFEVIGIPIKKAGFYVAEVQSKILGSFLLSKGRTMYVPTSTLVTNLSVHFKHGKDSSLVWVTTLDNAKPSAMTTVTIRDCKGNLVWKGTTDINGIAYINKKLPDVEKLPTCELKHGEDTFYDYPQLTALSNLGRGLFIFAKKDDDISFVHTSWDKGIEPWRYNLRQGDYRGGLKAHTIFDRPLYRAGDTVHMKHILRRLTQEGFDYIKRSDLPNVVEIIHQGSGQSYELNLKFDNLINAISDWQIPVEAKLGIYQVYLKNAQKGKEGTESILAGTFRVEEFKVPLMKAVINPVERELINPTKVDLDLSVQYLSGGGAKGAPIVLRTKTLPMDVYFNDYDDFEFLKGPVKIGMSKRGFYDDEENEEKEKESPLNTMNLTLDDYGFIRTKITLSSHSKKAQKITAELQFTDPNGEIQTISNQVPIYPSSISIGIKPESWSASTDNVKVHALTLDLRGNPVSNSQIKVEAYKKTYYSHRKRLIGGFYSYEHLTDIKKIKEVCRGKTNDSGIFTCEFKPKESGNFILQASTMDKNGNEAITHSELWISGKDEQWFDLSDSDRIDLIPIKKGYEPNEKARFQVRMPFREATALITVEREGILDAYIKNISGKNPVIELPLKSNYAPNVFVSALLVRGRVSDVRPTAMVDLGKPAFKLGIAEIRVGWKAHELNVQIKTDKDKYRVKEKVNAKIKIVPPDGVYLDKAKTSLAVAVVDEGLLELMNNKSWDLLQSMMEPRAYQIATSTAQMQIVGKRHFGMKALPHGGGGGRQLTRELFDTLIYWNPHVNIDENGEAEVSFNLNDSITSFRIAVIAYSDKKLFGTGFKSIKSWQDIMIFSGLPKIVRENDIYKAVFTVRNATDKTLDIQINATTSDTKQGDIRLTPKDVTLSSGQSLSIDWDVKIPQGIDKQEWLLEVKTKDGKTKDTIKVIQKVNSLYPIKIVHKEILPLDKPISLSIERPLSAIGGTTSIEARFDKTITSSLDELYSMMKDYPYTCLEQRVSKAVVLNDKSLWQSIINELPSYMDDSGLLRFFPSPSQNKGNDALTSYILSITHEAGINLPNYILEKLQEGLSSFIIGKNQGHSSLQTADLTIRKLSAIEALSRYNKIQALHISPLKIDVSVLPASALIDWINILKRVKDIPDRDKKYTEAVNNLTSRIVFHGSTVGLKTEKSDTLWWLMVSRDLIINRIILTFLKDSKWSYQIPRLVNGSITRQIKGIWDTTTANAWGYLAVKNYIKAFESNVITGKTTLSLDGVEHSFNWSDEGKKGKDNKPIEIKLGHQKAQLKAQHYGTGMPWLTVKSKSALLLKEPIYKGYKIKKTYQPLEQKQEGSFSVGDKIKVINEISASSDMTWVALKDPIPTGAVIISKGISKNGLNPSGCAIPTYEEKASDSYRAYFEYLKSGNCSIEYVIRLNTAGSFNLPETRVEALYAPELFAENPNKKFHVTP